MGARALKLYMTENFTTVLMCGLLFLQLFVYESINPLLIFSVLIFSYSLRFDASLKIPRWHLYVGLFLFATFMILRIQSLFLLGFVFVFLFILQNGRGRINALPICVGLLALPVTGTILNLISFNIRLITTRFVSTLLKLVAREISFEGNIIYYNNQAFGVDDVCSGIVMLQIGLLMALFLISYIERKYRVQVSMIQLLALLSFATLSILISNVFRIIAIVLFRLEDESVWHEFIGVISLVLYFAMPFYFILEKWASRFKSFQVIDNNPNKQSRVLVPSLIILTSIMVVASFFFLQQKKEVVLSLKVINGYQMWNFKYGVVQYSNANALIYVKPEVPFYAANHHPRLCWKGSGYAFTHEKMLNIEGHQIITAELKNQNKEILYSAYWFQHGQDIVSGDLDWRWNSLKKGISYKMINITASSEVQLHQEINRWIKSTRNIF
jgi:exosortase N